MKVIEIVGQNYNGNYGYERIACRGIIIEDGKILLSYDTKHKLYMLPGGGLEVGEDDLACAKREVLEETGMVIEATKCDFEINEYYGNEKYVTKYFYGQVVAKEKQHLTDEEITVGLCPKWLSLEDAINEFKRYDLYIGEDETAYGMYLRELTALESIGNK